jgi:hypothetical protein
MGEGVTVSEEVWGVDVSEGEGWVGEGDLPQFYIYTVSHSQKWYTKNE